MTSSAAARPQSGLDLAESQMGDVRVDHAAGENIYVGVPSEQLLPLIADALQDERQYRRTAAAVDARRHEATDARLDRMALVLGRLTATLIAQAVVLALLLLLVGQVLIVLLSPHLIARGGL